ncbi:TOM (translocase of outer membrane) complex component, partial [Paramarasmius palmivorus]
YMNMTLPKYEQVVEDCDEALKLDANYVKALNRRANALEALERYEDAITRCVLRISLSFNNTCNFV